MWMLLFLSLYYAIFAIDPNDLTGEMMKNMAITNRTLKWKKGSYGFQHFSHERCSGGKLVRATGYVLGRCLHISGLSGPAHRSVEYTSCDEDSVVIKYCTNSSDCSENCISYYLPFIYDECGDTVPICSRNENGWEDYEFNWHLLMYYNQGTCSRIHDEWVALPMESCENTLCTMFDEVKNIYCMGVCDE